MQTSPHLPPGPGCGDRRPKCARPAGGRHRNTQGGRGDAQLASGEAGSRREGGREAQPVEGGGAARGTPGPARRVLAPGNVSLALSQCSGTATTNSYSFRNADLLCIRWDYIYIYFLSIWVFGFCFCQNCKILNVKPSVSTLLPSQSSTHTDTHRHPG